LIYIQSYEIYCGNTKEYCVERGKYTWTYKSLLTDSEGEIEVGELINELLMSGCRLIE